MPVFTIQIPDGRTLDIEAGDEATALRGAQEFAAGSPSASAPAPASPSPAATEPAAAAPTQGPDLLGSFASFLTEGVNNIPILGPALRGASDFVGSEIGGRLTGEDPAKMRERLAAQRAEWSTNNPIAAGTGMLAGQFAPFVAATKIPALAMSLGMEGGFGTRLANSITSGAAMAGGDTAMRGGDIGEILKNAGMGAGLSGAMTGVGAGLGAGVGYLGSKMQPVFGAVTDATKEAARRTGLVVQRDMKVNPGSVMNSTDEAVAAANNVPVFNADRGGETTRALVRAVANQSPEARYSLTKAADDRFETQFARATDAIKRIAGGNVDDLAYQENSRLMAKAANGPAYKAANNAPAARAIWTPQIKQLMQSDSFRKAASLTTSTGTDFAAVSGGKAVRNPFTFGADGSVSIKKLADGSTPLPSLQYWDMVKRNLDGMIGAAQKGGDNTQVSLLTQMKNMLTSELDAAVPEYAVARSGAHSFFKADDALEAGKKFVSEETSIPEARKAFNSMNQSEQHAFRTGFASEILDRIKVPTDRRNLITSHFSSPAKREMMELVFGPAKAKELEAWVRIETMVDKLRGALGNSTTARQWKEMALATGAGAGTGYALSGGNLTTAAAGAAVGAGIRRGAGAALQHYDDKVMQEIAKLLTSSDPNAISNAVKTAALSSKWMDTLRRVEQIIEGGARATVPPMLTDNPKSYVDIQVNGGNRSLAP